MTDRLEQLLHFHEENPEDTFVLFALAREYLKLDEANKAISYYEKVLVIDENYVGAYYHKGLLLGELGRVEDALACLRLGLVKAEEQNSPREKAEILQAIAEYQD